MTKNKRRGNGEGTIRERVRDGKVIGWEALISYIDLETGLVRRKSLSAKTRPAVLARKKAFEQELEKLGGLPSQERTVAHLLDEWLNSVRMRVGLKTLEDYTRIVETRLKPALGEIPITKLKLVDIEKMARKLVEAGKPNEANRAVARLRMALSYAVEHDWIASNVAERYKPVPVPAKHHGIWQPDQVRTFLEVMQGHKEHVMYTVFLTTGMRSAEVRGLRWKDINLTDRTIHVRQQWLEAAKASESRFAPPKRGSARHIHIQEGLVQLLLQHRARQEAERAELGEAWVDFDLVFPSAIGTPMLSTNLLRQFKKDTELAGLPVIRVHDMRDTAASVMLASGTPLTLVSEILGHQDTSVTLKKYVHVLDQQRAAYPVGQAMYTASDEHNDR